MINATLTLSFDNERWSAGTMGHVGRGADPGEAVMELMAVIGTAVAVDHERGQTGDGRLQALARACGYKWGDELLSKVASDLGMPERGVNGMPSEEERAAGFVRPVRRSYMHLKCGSVTSIGIDIAEKYARDPNAFQFTFCVGCHRHSANGEAGDFVWNDNSNEKVGT